MALTNPTSLVNVQDLDHFKGKLDPRFNNIEATIGIDTDYEFVDLGLPSGTLWAKCNVGAETETDYGNYYMYGKGATQYFDGDSKYEGTEDPLDPTRDTATQVMGTTWHMPTKEQMDELIANTTYTWEDNFKGSKRSGGKFTASNGNYIFLPAGGYKYIVYGYVNVDGYYWSSTPADTAAKCLYLRSDAHGTDNGIRNRGFNVRGVKSGGLIQTKADKSELPTFATTTTCEDIIGELN